MNRNRTFRAIDSSPAPHQSGGFTLLELLLSVAIFSVVLLAINTVFFSALRLRRSSQESLDRSLPLQQAFARMREDLLSAVPRGASMAGDFRVGSVSASPGMAQGLGIELYTTSGRLTAGEPWPELQRVVYQLRDPADKINTVGRELIRSVDRNLLTSLTSTPEEEFLMGGIESLEIECYTGLNWQTGWDTSLTETNLPVAVRVKLLTVTAAGGNARLQEPYQMVVPLRVQSPAGTVSEEEEP